ncbi:cyclic AMP-dependent transcription factor ATF-7-like isoform X3 [Branchiostoma floridae]|uniref:Cyclic AMP-dependent transcription factor ATF-7-like isoform X3 n=1 Tax=Branchiostoma floridae TaxID=7739 RepID=A0A9J7K5A7_BRAFL|nr:cyclic AMP-dependent transcription factor ATF-7-like isoform X3 [Branchiostoma floridae]
MGDDDKPFACPSCGQRFANEDHLSVHKHKHEMTLKFGPPKLDGLVVDQTPTPTRFLKNCEEVGLFQELSGASPFEQDFKKASEQSTSQDSGDQSEPAETAPLPAPETRVPAPAAPVAHVAPVSMETSTAPTQPEPTRVNQPPQVAATNVVTSPSVTMATQELVPTIGIAGTVSTVITQAPAGMARQMNTFQGSLPVLLHLPNGTTMPVAVPVPASIANPSVQVPSAIPAPQSSPTGSTIQQQHPVQPPQSEAKLEPHYDYRPYHLPTGPHHVLRLKAALAGSSMPGNMSVMSQAVDVIMSQQQQQQQHATPQDLSQHRMSMDDSPPMSMSMSPSPPTSPGCSPPYSGAGMDTPPPATTGRRRRGQEKDPELRRQRFLERNRAAAARCRQKRKLWVQSLEKKAEDLTATNLQLQSEVSLLRNEVAQLKQLLLAHKDCPIMALQQKSHATLLQGTNRRKSPGPNCKSDPGQSRHHDNNAQLDDSC